jgi:hypothetical protein
LPRSTAKIATKASRGAQGYDPSPETIELERFDPDLLRRRWRTVMGRHPSKTLSQALMARILTWREQVVEVGDISPRARAILVEALRGKGDRAAVGSGRADESRAMEVPYRKTLRTGTVLVREHGGVLHRVTAMPDGFEWRGQTFRSLSAVARAIAGVSWSGRRFFGLGRSGRGASDRCGLSRSGSSSRVGGP